MSRWPISFVASFSLVSLALLSGGTSVQAEEPPAPEMPAEMPAEVAPIDLQNTVCPVRGIAVKAGVTETVDGAIVHFCCTMCAGKYRKDPAAYEAALRTDPAVAQRLDHAQAGHMATPMAAPPVAQGDVLHDGMRQLWEDHVSWTRLFLVSTLGSLPDLEATTKRLLKNQVDLGDAIKPYYGEAAGTKLSALLKDHILTAADLVGAMVSKDTAKTDAAKTKWYANADDIAVFLHGANPTAWSLEDAKAMMREHLDLTAAEVEARIQQDWDADISIYARIRIQALAMADMLTSGIQQQFPAKFR